MHNKPNARVFFNQSLRKFFICVHIWPTCGQKQNSLVNISTILNITSLKKSTLLASAHRGNYPVILIYC